MGAPRPSGAMRGPSRLETVLVGGSLDGHGDGFFGGRLLCLLADEVGQAGDLTLSATGDLVEAAANLFHLLREADRLAQGRAIAFAPVPDTGLGRAINDRLTRAAAPRG